MKAAVLYGKEDIRYEEVETPKVVSGYVKVRVKACGICGSDMPRYFEGRVHKFPLILGHEFSGEIVEVADDVTDIKLGSHVVGVPLVPCKKCVACKQGNYSLCEKYNFLGSRSAGALAEYIVLPKENVYIIGDQIPFDKAAFFEVSTVAVHALQSVKFRGGSEVAVLGTGTVGLMTIQWAKLMGASKIVAFGHNEKTFDLAYEVGADRVVSTKRADFDAYKNSFDYIFEAAGADQTMHLMFELIRNKGIVCLIGTPKDKLNYSVKEWEIINRKEFTLTGSWMSYSAPFPGIEWKLTEQYLNNGKLKIPVSMISKKFDLINTKMAFNWLKKSPNVGRVMICNGFECD